MHTVEWVHVYTYMACLSPYLLTIHEWNRAFQRTEVTKYLDYCIKYLKCLDGPFQGVDLKLPAQNSTLSHSKLLEELVQGRSAFVTLLATWDRVKLSDLVVLRTYTVWKQRSKIIRFMDGKLIVVSACLLQDFCNPLYFKTTAAYFASLKMRLQFWGHKGASQNFFANLRHTNKFEGSIISYQNCLTIYLLRLAPGWCSISLWYKAIL